MIGKILASIFLAILFAPFTPDASSLQPNQREEPAVRLAAELVLVPVEVVNKKTGLPVDGLKKDDFVVFEDGVPQEISFFSQEDIPFRVILALPSPLALSSRPGVPSSRYEGFVKSVERARRLAIRMVDFLRPGDSVAVFTICGGNLTLTLSLTDDLVKVRERLEEMGREGSCERGAIIGIHRLMLMELVKYTSQYSGRISRPIILLINEDLVDPNRPEFPLKDLVTEIINSGATICAIDLQTPFGKYITTAKGILYSTGIGYFRLRTKLLGYFSDLTGGLIIKENVEKPEATVREMVTFLEKLRGGYVLGFRPNRDRFEGQLVKIKVGLSPSAKKKYKDVQLRHRQGYIAASGRVENPNK